jgi:hypothetical protein
MPLALRLISSPRWSTNNSFIQGKALRPVTIVSQPNSRAVLMISSTRSSRCINTKTRDSIGSGSTPACCSGNRALSTLRGDKLVDRLMNSDSEFVDTAYSKKRIISDENTHFGLMSHVTSQLENSLKRFVSSHSVHPVSPLHKSCRKRSSCGGRQEKDLAAKRMIVLISGRSLDVIYI